ncbi:EAL domain-containing protein [Arcobacter cloacae]|uniref:Uncharacterized protein n=1 Tax=Arcobacter cloacae TaxID=1054034 RepID=A0A6M8NKV7_9BACT|nr:EAL domain-containing protein [Arcobacter cloacae]QKF91189.1 diguanylate cyclase/phosphodiesterase [Arcobacter cloacae]RXI40436.1 hypothetical protein CP963_08580 [Arcobacter cloacae]
MLYQLYRDAVKNLDFAYQPIIDFRNGKAFAFEALLRNCEDIDVFFDNAYNNKTLFGIDIELRKKAVLKLLPFYEENPDILLFYNIDNRILEMDDYKSGITNTLLDCFGLDKQFVTFEVSEKHQFNSMKDAEEVLNSYKNQGFSIAIDDFGTGYSGLKMLYHLSPDFIKIDRFFISDIVNDYKKKLFVANVINIAHELNIKVIAEGIETLEEYIACVEIGCDLGQGYFIQRPTQNIEELKDFYFINYKKFYDFKITDFNLNNVYYTSNNYLELIDKYIIASATDSKGRITSISQAFCNLSGYEKHELLGKYHSVVKNPQNSKKFFSNLWNTIRNGDIWTGEISNKNKDGSIYWIYATIIPNYSSDKKLLGFTSLGQNITEKKYLEKVVITDYLTGIYNKKYFEENLIKFIEKAIKFDFSLTLAFIDIDNFKLYNDTYGHNNADKALIKIAQCVQNLCTKNDILCRIGGEEFALISLNKNQISSKDFLVNMCDSVENLKIKHEKNQNISSFITISCGAIFIKKENLNMDSEIFIQLADNLLYKAKKNGKNKIFFEEISK